MMERKNRKINRLSLLLVVIHTIIVITIAYQDSLRGSRGFGLVAILWMDTPISYIIMPLSDFIDSVYKIPLFILIPALAVIFGGLQWYCIGWLISSIGILILKLKQKILTGLKLKNNSNK